ncbi:MAG: hypothetical protein RL272_223 [Candidatus Parcubacteria bacterium]|jgi:hypothetical protein
MSDRSSDDSKKSGRNYIASALFGALTIALAGWLWPSAIPFGAFDFWPMRGTVGDWLSSAWPAFAWGGGLTAIIAFATRNKREVNRDAEGILIGGTIISLWAGVMEEICFRWLIFLSTIFWGKVVNFILLGFMGWGIPEHLFLWIFRPLADFTTLHGLHATLYSQHGWAIGAAMLGANGLFRDGHKYLGFFGYLNSWFMGMFFFWIMFSYGLPAAILVHFLYDLLIFGIRYVDAAIERAQGNA